MAGQRSCASDTTIMQELISILRPINQLLSHAPSLSDCSNMKPETE